MKRTLTLALGVAVFSVSAPAYAAAPVLGAKCASAQWGQTSSGLTCAQTGKTVYAWVKLPAAKPTAVATTKPTTAPKPVANGKTPTADFIPEGQWLVGTEVQPGTYRTVVGDCYYERLAGFSGDLGDIIDNGSTAANGGIVTIKATDKAFESRCAWNRIA